MTLAVESPAERVEQLTALTERLRGLVERETALFEARKPMETEALRDEAATLARLYRTECARISRDAALIAGAPQDLRDKLRQETELFHTALDAHMKAVTTLSTLTEGLVRAVADHVAQQRKSLNSYGPGAAQTAKASQAAITLNRTT